MAAKLLTACSIRERFFKQEWEGSGFWIVTDTRCLQHKKWNEKSWPPSFWIMGSVENSKEVFEYNRQLKNIGECNGCDIVTIIIKMKTLVKIGSVYNNYNLRISEIQRDYFLLQSDYIIFLFYFRNVFHWELKASIILMNLACLILFFLSSDHFWRKKLSRG